MSKEKRINENNEENDITVNTEYEEVTKESEVKSKSEEQETKKEDKIVENKLEKRLGASENLISKTSEQDKKNKKIRLIIMIILAVIFAIVILFAAIVCINKLNDKVYTNVLLFDHNVGGMSNMQVEEILNAANQNISNNKISVYQGTEEIATVTSQEIGLSIDVAKTVTNTMGFGRINNMFINNFKILMALVKPVHIDISYTYDVQKLDEIVKNIDLTIKDRAVDDSYSLDEQNKKIVITRGKSGNSIDYEVEKENILSALKDTTNTKLVLNIISRKPQDLDVDKVYSEVKREAKDAYVDETSKPIKFIAEVVGIDFDINKLIELLNTSENKQEGKVIEFPLTITEPKVKLQDISSNYYNDKLAGKTTYFDASQTARANNLNIALSYLNGKIIMPGEVFSYNDVIGDTSVAKGYLPAATFKGGTVVNELGGGICQTTSTLYDVALMANLEIVERHQHGLPVGYVQPSLDATVYSPVLDFKFKNTRNYPIKIVTSYSSAGNMNVSIYGTKESNEYEITLSSKVVGTIPFTTKYIYDNNLDDGTQIIVSNGVNGYISEGYLTRTQNGQYVDSRMLSRDTYNAQQQVVRVGTRQAAS